jgi:6-phosphogluconate dehydrogenase
MFKAVHNDEGVLMAETTGVANIGVVGLAVMGSNLARNLASRDGNTVAVYNRTYSRTETLLNEHPEAKFVGSKDIKDFVDSLEKPRAALIMVQAGAGTDAVIDELSELFEEGDIIIDGGNSLFTDTIRREKTLREKGLNFVGTGISGGEEGALNGPSIMPGGSDEAWEKLGPIFESIAAVAEGEPCVTHVGHDGAGHFVKMIHNGIEYADMQLIAEAYDLIRHGTGATPAEIAEIFTEWNKGELESYLIEITAEVLKQVDAETGKPLVDVILDQAGSKGTGVWTVQNALDLGIPVSGIAEAVFARALSSKPAQRAAASDLPGHQEGRDREDLARWLHHPGTVLEPNHGCLQREPGPGRVADGAVFQGRHRGRTGQLADRCRTCSAVRHPDPCVLVIARVLRRNSRRAPARRARAGAARLLRSAHVPPRRQGRRVPHPVVGRPHRDRD